MKVQMFSFESVSSTSIEASRILKEKDAPFGVVAREQTQGRGRRGHHWNSPIGNMYLTLVLPGSFAKTKNAGIIPYAMATYLCEFLHSQYGFRPTLKWPNDVLFGGKKLAGILCESTVNGMSIAEILTGIGLNVQVAPHLQAPDQATCLTRILGYNVDPQEVATGLSAYIVEQWAKIAIPEILERGLNYGLLPGNIWQNAEGMTYRHGAVTSEGTLSLLPHYSQAPKILDSLDHRFRWVYLGETANSFPIIIADIGNSVTKIVCFDKARDPSSPSHTWSIQEGNLDAALRGLRKIWPKGPWPIFTISVNPERLKTFQSLLVDSPFYATIVPKNRVARIVRSNYKITDIGVDRLALMEGVLEVDRSTKPKIAISFGTATTIDLLSPNRQHLGGWIFPGLKSYLEALHFTTAALPLFDAQALKKVPGGDPDQVIGTDTESAILNGLYLQTVGTVYRLQEWLKSEYKQDASVYVTGGAAECVTAPADWLIRKDLVAQGIRSMVLGGTQS